MIYLLAPIAALGLMAAGILVGLWVGPILRNGSYGGSQDAEYEDATDRRTLDLVI